MFGSRLCQIVVYIDFDRQGLSPAVVFKQSIELRRSLFLRPFGSITEQWENPLVCFGIFQGSTRAP